LLAVQAELHVRAGAWEDARAEAGEAVRRADRLGQRAHEAAAWLWLARIAACRGDAGTCRDHLTRIRELAVGHRLRSLLVPAEVTEGLLDLSLGDAEAAYVRLAAVAREAGPPDLGRLPWVGDLVEAAVHSGRPADARSAAGRVRADGSHPLSAVLARCAALTTPVGSADLYRRAAGTPEPFEAARARLLLGESLDPGEEAEAELRRARDAFDRLGARAWADRARRALDQPRSARARGEPGGGSQGDAGQPVPAWRVAGLTAQEARVAELVGRGATNREAAETLYLSPKTVEFHLRGVYRKLGLRSRAELAHLVGQDRCEP
jgi:DNA-binding CsgD family transcriptional regulator